MHFIFLSFMLQPTRKLKSLSLAVLWQTSSFILMKKELFLTKFCSPSIPKSSNSFTWGREEKKEWKEEQWSIQILLKKDIEKCSMQGRHECFVAEKYSRKVENHISLNVMLENSPIYSYTKLSNKWISPVLKIKWEWEEAGVINDFKGD